MATVSDFENIFSSHITYENPWKEISPIIADYYSSSPRARGSWAEAICEDILRERSHIIIPPIGTGHDRIIDGIKTEIKFGLATECNTDWETMFNHISKGKDWEQVLFACINGTGEIAMTIYAYREIQDIIEKFNPQQGGKSIGNDDFMVAGPAAAELVTGALGGYRIDLDDTDVSQPAYELQAIEDDIAYCWTYSYEACEVAEHSAFDFLRVPGDYTNVSYKNASLQPFDKNGNPVYHKVEWKKIETNE